MFLFCLVFAMSLCASVYMCFVVTCWERADLLALVCDVYYAFVTFPHLTQDTIFKNCQNNKFLETVLDVLV